MMITTRIRLLTAGAVVVTAMCVGLISFRGYRSLITSVQKDSLAQNVTSESRRLNLALQEHQNDVHLLATLPVIQAIADEIKHGAPMTQDSERKSQLAQVFAEMLRSKPFYVQVRLIGIADDGREIVRADRTGDGIVRIEGANLQQKADRDYFRETLARPAGQIYMSSISLNREHGKIEFPHRPMLRVAQRVDDESESPIGIVIINLDFARFIDDLFADVTRTSALYLTNSDGDYLVHPDATRTFGFDLGQRYRIQDEFPGTGILFEERNRRAIFQSSMRDTGNHRFLHFCKVLLHPNDPEEFVTLGIAASGTQLASGALAISRDTSIATLALVALALIAAILATRFLTRPIESITLAANRLAQGESTPPLPVSRTDEIGVLSRAFDKMTASIQKKEAKILEVNSQLVATNNDLEHFVHIASHDLREPLRKQRNLVDLLLPELPKDASPEARQYAEFISVCSTQMQEMVDAFRALTKLGYANPVRKPTSLQPLIEECLSPYADEIERRGIRVSFDPFPKHVNLYPMFARQLYANLIENAMNHVKVDEFDLALTARETDRGWIFGVRNTGSTIPKHECQEIFNIFRKAGIHESEGTGLGLSICRKIAERHQGVISVESEENEVHFQFTFGEERHADHDHQ